MNEKDVENFLNDCLALAHTVAFEPHDAARFERIMQEHLAKMDLEGETRWGWSTFTSVGGKQAGLRMAMPDRAFYVTIKEILF